MRRFRRAGSDGETSPAPPNKAEPADRVRVTVSVRLLIVWTLTVVAATLAPFDFGSTMPLHEHSFQLFQYGRYERDPIDFTVNVLMFMPLGALLYRSLERRALGLSQIVLRIVFTGLLLSSVLEFFQQFVPSRDSSLLDVAANTAGSLIGVFAARAWATSIERQLGALRAQLSTAALAGALAVMLVLTLLLSGALQARSRLSNWSPEYPLLIGNERTGDRPWRGQVFGVTITDAATEPAAVQRFAGGGSIDLPGQPLVSFDFNGRAPFKDATRHLPALVWTEASPASNGAGVTLPGRPWLQSQGPAGALAEKLQWTNAFSIRIQCATSVAAQRGPARILSNSLSTLVRNFTLGQQDDDLVIRLRTPQTGLNGYPLETIVEGVFSSSAPRDILVTYDGATLLAAVAQMKRVVRTELTPASALAPVITMVTSTKVRGDQLQTVNIVYMGLLFVAPGLLIALLGRSRRHQLVLFGLYLLATTVLLEATLVVASGRPFDWTNMAVTGAIGAIVLTVIAALLLPTDIARTPLRARWLPAQTWG